jgi:hypothetical protein
MNDNILAFGAVAMLIAGLVVGNFFGQEKANAQIYENCKYYERTVLEFGGKQYLYNCTHP